MCSCRKTLKTWAVKFRLYYFRDRYPNLKSVGDHFKSIKIFHKMHEDDTRKYERAIVLLTLPSDVAGFTTDSGKLSNP